MIDYSVQMQLVITKNSLGFMVYDEAKKNYIDVFPDTTEGFQRLMDFLQKTLDAERLNKTQK
jgi:hypothetical protein